MVKLIIPVTMNHTFPPRCDVISLNKRPRPVLYTINVNNKFRYRIGTPFHAFRVPSNSKTPGVSMHHDVRRSVSGGTQYIKDLPVYFEC